MTRKLLIAGNWKMNGTIEDSKSRIQNLSSLLSGNNRGADVLVCPPFTLISTVLELSKGTPISVGAQDCHFNKSGAHTGDTSAGMLKDLGCKYVIVGHSERRANHSESNEIVKSKVNAVLENGLIAIVCIGETLQEKQSGKTIEVVQNQIRNSLSESCNAENTVIAYEPVWAIGTAITPTTEEISETHAKIREYISSLKGNDIANNMKILYGGSLNPSNAKEILAIEDVDGGLIGGASLKAEDFFKIIDSI